MIVIFINRRVEQNIFTDLLLRQSAVMDRPNRSEFHSIEFLICRDFANFELDQQLLAVSAMDGIMAATNSNNRIELEVYTSVVVVVVVVAI